jgi:lipopolysaccharide export system permease protein
MMRHLNDLTSKGIDLGTIVEFLALNVSWILVLAVPIGVLFASLMAFGSMSAQHEVTVIKASGMGLLQMMLPIIVSGTLLWIFTFWYADNVLPDTNLRLSTMIRDIQRLKPTFAIESGRFTTQIEGFTILARNVDTTGLMTGVTIYDRSRPYRLNVVSADSGTLAFSPSLTRIVLQLYHGEVHQSLTRNIKDYRVVSFERHQITMPADRFFFERSDVSGTSRGDREMRISDMRKIEIRSDSMASLGVRNVDSMLNEHLAYLFGRRDTALEAQTPLSIYEATSRASTLVNTLRSTLEGESYRSDAERRNADKYEVEIQKKYAIPFACFLFVFVGCPLGILVRGGNFGISAAISLACYVAYWITLIGGETLADRNLLHPAVAMWMGNVLFLIVGGYATIKVNAS